VSALIVFRHGKSDWDTGQDDRERPLASRGRKAARTMGRLLSRAGQAPDAAICSPAVRADETLRLAMEAGDWKCPVRVAHGLYEGGVEGALAEIRAEASEAGLLVVVGHEPTSSELAGLLIGGGRIGLPTGAALRIDFEEGTSWSDVGPGIGELAWMLVPRLFPKESFEFAD
jgi:phosphohistidine phosphatase